MKPLALDSYVRTYGAAALCTPASDVARLDFDRAPGK